MTTLEEERPVLLMTTVDIEDQSKDVIVREGDDPKDVARLFCEENGLNDTVMDALAEHLLEQLHLQEADKATHQDLAVPQGATPAPVHSHSPPVPSGGEPHYSDSPTIPADRGSRPAFVTDSTVMAEQPGEEPRRKKKPSSRSQSAHRSESPAYERLYMNAEQTRSKHERARREQEKGFAQMAQSFRRSMNHIKTDRQLGTHEPGSGPGDRLYAEGVLRKKTKQEELQKMRIEEEEEKYKESCTFKPQISNLAQRLVSKNDRAAWERLHENARRKQEQLRNSQDARKTAGAEEDLKECTFVPQIDKNSAKMMGERTEALRGSAISVFDQLSQDALRRRMRLEEYANWFPEEATFQPKILDVSRAMVEKKSVVFGEGDRDSPARPATAPTAEGESPTDGAAVEEKLLARGRASELRMSAARASKEGNVDPATGRRLFKPETGRPPAFGRDLKGLSVNQFLYERGLDALKKKQEMKSLVEERQRKGAASKFVLSTSEKMLNRLKRKRFRKVYEYLRQVLDQEGLLPPHPEDQVPLEADFSSFLDEHSALLDDLDPEVRRDVDVVLQVAAQEQRGGRPQGAVLLDEPTFVAYMEHVVQGPREYLQPGSSRPRTVEEFSFKPMINMDEESQRMAARRRPGHMKIFEILLAERHTVEDKVQALKVHIETERHKECRFQPETNKSFVQSRYFRSSVGGAPGSGVRGSYGPPGGDGVEGAAAYDDLEREVRAILEKHSGSAAAPGAIGPVGDAMVDDLHSLIGGKGGSQDVMRQLARHMNDDSPAKGKGQTANLPWEVDDA